MCGVENRSWYLRQAAIMFKISVMVLMCVIKLTVKDIWKLLRRKFAHEPRRLHLQIVSYS